MTSHVFRVIIFYCLTVSCTNENVCQKTRSWKQIDGDVIITAILDLHCDRRNCEIISQRNSEVLQVAIQLIHLFNKKRLVPGIKFGLQVYDSCCDIQRTRNMAMKALIAGNYTLCGNQIFAGFLGPSNMESSQELTKILKPFHIPHLQLAPHSEDHNGLTLVKNELFNKIKALLSLIEELKIYEATIIYSDDIFGKTLLKHFQTLNKSKTFCRFSFLKLNNETCEEEISTVLVLLTSEQSFGDLLQCLQKITLYDCVIITIDNPLKQLKLKQLTTCKYTFAIEEIIIDLKSTKNFEALHSEPDLIYNYYNSRFHKVLIRKTISSFYLIAEALRKFLKKKCNYKPNRLCSAAISSEPSDWLKILSSVNYVFKDTDFKELEGQFVGFGDASFSSLYIYLFANDSESLNPIGLFDGEKVLKSDVLKQFFNENVTTDCSPTCNCASSLVALLPNSRISSTHSTEKRGDDDSVVLRLPEVTDVPVSDLIGYLAGLGLCVIVLIVVCLVFVFKIISWRTRRDN